MASLQLRPNVMFRQIAANCFVWGYCSKHYAWPTLSAPPRLRAEPGADRGRGTPASRSDPAGRPGGRHGRRSLDHCVMDARACLSGALSGWSARRPGYSMSSAYFVSPYAVVYYKPIVNTPTLASPFDFDVDTGHCVTLFFYRCARLPRPPNILVNYSVYKLGQCV